MSEKTLIQPTIINVISTVEYGYINVTLTFACYLGYLYTHASSFMKLIMVL
jgi:hypothetical protein